MPDLKVIFKTLEWKFRETTVHYSGYSEIPKKKITAPDDFVDLFRPLLKEEASEVFLVAYLSTFNKVIAFEIVTKGILNASLVDVRSIFKGAIVSNCASLILAHNHPSGNPEPSNEDISITNTLIEAGKIIGIRIFDHIIVAGELYTSFVERRLM
jgi:DNA repair protein RadC